MIFFLLHYDYFVLCVFSLDVNENTSQIMRLKLCLFYIHNMRDIYVDVVCS